MDRRGSGFKKILSAYKSLPNFSEEKLPVFTSEYDCFFLTMQNLNYGVVEDDSVEQQENSKKTARKQQENNKKISDSILKVVSDKPDISINEISKALNITVGSTRYQIEKLKKSVVLERVGADKGGYLKKMAISKKVTLSNTNQE